MNSISRSRSSGRSRRIHSRTPLRVLDCEVQLARSSTGTGAITRASTAATATEAILQRLRRRAMQGNDRGARVRQPLAALEGLQRAIAQNGEPVDVLQQAGALTDDYDCCAALLQRGQRFHERKLAIRIEIRCRLVEH